MAPATSSRMQTITCALDQVCGGTPPGPNPEARCGTQVVAGDMKHATTEGDWWRILQGVGDARRGRANIDLDKVRPHLVKYGAPASSFQGILNHYMGR